MEKKQNVLLNSPLGLRQGYAPTGQLPLLNPLEEKLKTNRLSEKLSQRHSTKSLKHSRFFEGKARESLRKTHTFLSL